MKYFLLLSLFIRRRFRHFLEVEKLLDLNCFQFDCAPRLYSFRLFRWLETVSEPNSFVLKLKVVQNTIRAAVINLKFSRHIEKSVIYRKVFMLFLLFKMISFSLPKTSR